MYLPDKKIVINKLAQKYECSFSMIKGKQIMYQGIVDGGQRIVICTPYSKIHTLLDEADVSVLVSSFGRWERLLCRFQRTAKNDDSRHSDCES